MGNPKQALKKLDQEKQAYLAMRSRLLKKYFGKWVAVAEGRVASSGHNPLKVLGQAYAKGFEIVYLDKVGSEDRLTIRIRRTTWPYDTRYEPFAMPRIRVTVSNIDRTRRRVYPDAIPDTGADVSAVPLEDCESLGILANPVRQFPVAWVGQDEVLIGRDVLNNFRLTLDGKRNRVRIDC